MKNLFLNYKGRSTWKNFFYKKKFFYHKILKKKFLTRNFLITKFLVKNYKFIFIFFRKGYFKFYIDNSKIGFKIGQFLFTKLYGQKMHILKKKKKK